MARIIFDAVAKAHFLQHFEIVLGAHPQPLRFEQLRLRLQLDNTFLELFTDRAQRAIEFVRRSNELFRRIKCKHGQRFVGMAGEGIEAGNRVELVAEEFEPNCFFVGRGRINLDHVPPHAESSTRKIHVVAFVEHVDQTAEHGFATDLLAFLYGEQHPFIIFRRSDAVDAGDAGNHDGVAPGKQRAGGGES